MNWIIFGEEYRSLSSSLCSFLHSPVVLSLLGPNTLLSTRFFNTLSLRPSLKLRDQVSHPYKATGKIIVLYILIFIFLYRKREYKRFYTKWQQAFIDCNLLLISSRIQLRFCRMFPNIRTVTTFKRSYYQSLYCDFVLCSNLETWPYNIGHIISTAQHNIMKHVADSAVVAVSLSRCLTKGYKCCVITAAVESVLKCLELSSLYLGKVSDFTSQCFVEWTWTLREKLNFRQ